MSDDFLTDPGQDADGSSLRKFGNSQKARADALEAELNKLKGELTAKSRKELLGELKIPEKLHDFYTGDLTKEAVTAWKEEKKDVFNFGDSAGITTTDGTSTQDGNGIQIPAEIVAQQQRLQAAADGAHDNAGAVGLDAFKAEAMQFMSSGPKSEADLDALLGKFLKPGGLTAPQEI